MTQIPVKVKRTPRQRMVVVLCTPATAAAAAETFEYILASGREPVYIVIRDKEGDQ